MKIISRAEAKALGLKRYFTGIPCKRGHVAERSTSKATCLACKAEDGRLATAKNPEALRASRHAHYLENREKHLAQGKDWAAAHREQLKTYNAAYHLANKEKANAASAQWYLENREKMSALSKERYAKNPEKYKLSTRLRYEANPERVIKYGKEWRKRNPEKYRVQVQTRRARKAAAGGKLSPDIVERLLKLQRGRCACCGKPLGKKYHVDHIVPLARGGSNTDDNVQLLTQRCNNQKSAKDPIDFMQSRGKLL